MGNRSDSQLAAIEMDAGCIVVCSGSKVSKVICMLAAEKGCIVISTPNNTYVSGQMISQATPIRHYMVQKNLLTFNLNSSVDSVTKVMASVRFRYFPVLDDEGRYVGVVSRRNLMNLHKKQLILVDHNERSQAVDGIDQAEVLEIIDHHRIGSLETEGPVYFRNVPVGCTCTIIYQLYQETGVEIEGCCPPSCRTPSCSAAPPAPPRMKRRPGPWPSSWDWIWSAMPTPCLRPAEM